MSLIIMKARVQAVLSVVHSCNISFVNFKYFLFTLNNYAFQLLLAIKMAH